MASTKSHKTSERFGDQVRPPSHKDNADVDISAAFEEIGDSDGSTEGN